MSREVYLSKAYVKLFEELYNEYIELGQEPEQAQCRAHDKVSYTKELIEEVLEELDSDGWYCSLRRVIPTGMIENWATLDFTEKETTLYELGVDVRMPWREKRGEFLCGGKKMDGSYVEGSESTEEWWVKSGYASFESELEYQEQVHGKEHVNDLKAQMRWG